MEAFDEAVHEGVVLLDAGVVHDIALALTGVWHPTQEPDERRRAELVAAARLRIYGGGDQFGWELAATPAARAQSLGYPGADWSVGFIRDVSTMPGTPPEQDVEALAGIFAEERIPRPGATALAYAVLFQPVAYLITPDPVSLKHQRADDRPSRLEIIDSVEAVERLKLVPGELPEILPPLGSELDTGDRWWAA